MESRFWLWFLFAVGSKPLSVLSVPCCTTDLMNCGSNPFCNADEENCVIECGGYWHDPDTTNDPNCTAINKDCETESSCCGDLVCLATNGTFFYGPLSCEIPLPSKKCVQSHCCSWNFRDCADAVLPFPPTSQEACSTINGFWIPRSATMPQCSPLNHPCQTTADCCGVAAGLGVICQQLQSVHGPYMGCAVGTIPSPSSIQTSSPTPKERTPVPTAAPSEDPTTTQADPTKSPTMKSATPTQSPTTTILTTAPATSTHVGWAFQETFDGDPATPSQDLLPRNFDYVVTHRTHPGEHFSKNFEPFPVDHGSDCTGPNPNITPLPQHYVHTSHLSNGTKPDESFFICKDHMMSSMGDVEGYSVTAFYPRQEFAFGATSEKRTLEFEVGITSGHLSRSWWELMLTPRDQLKVGAAIDWLPISETYPNDRIVFEFERNTRKIRAGTGAVSPGGWTLQESQWWSWPEFYPSDPALSDRRIRRKMRITFDDNQHITWGIETEDGSFDEWSVSVPGGFPFSQGLVVFKTHAYTPQKEGNYDAYTFHWDNIFFDGPVVGKYVAFDANEVVYLESNGNRPIGDAKTITIELQSVGRQPVLFGQIHSPTKGQVLLSINGAPNVIVEPYDYENSACTSEGWKSFRLPLSEQELNGGTNYFEWTVGTIDPSCVVHPWHWDGFSVKSLQLQFDQ